MILGEGREGGGELEGKGQERMRKKTDLEFNLIKQALLTQTSTKLTLKPQ